MMGGRRAVLAAALLAAGIVVTGACSSGAPSESSEPPRIQARDDTPEKPQTQPEASEPAAQTRVAVPAVAAPVREQTGIDEPPDVGALGLARDVFVVVDKSFLNTPPMFQPFRQLLPRDDNLPIYELEFIAGTPKSLHPGELVIGVEVNGESKAYPLSHIRTFSEVTNDVVGGVPVLVSY